MLTKHGFFVPPILVTQSQGFFCKMRLDAGSKSAVKKQKKGKNTKNCKVVKSRKDLRKEQRKQKKLARVIYFQKKKEFRDRLVKNGEIECENEKQKPKKDLENPESRKFAAEAKNLAAKAKKERELERRKMRHRKKLLKEENLREDRVIKQLEKQLKLNKRKKKTVPKSFVADGLDYLLDFCIDEDRSRIIETERQLLENELDTEFKKDLTMITGEDSEHEVAGESELPEREEDERDNADIGIELEDLIESSSEHEAENLCMKLPKKRKGQQKHEIQNMVEDGDTSMDAEDENIAEDNNEIWEDIYGRRRDKEGNIIQENKYVPPAARRAISDTNDEKLVKLKRQLKGALNRLAEHNIHSISNQVEELYMTNSRNDMNEMLARLMIEALVAPVLTPDRLIAEHMMLVAILHANVGIEVGAQFLLKLIKLWDDMLKKESDVENKELDNLVLMIAHLYNFKIYGQRLLYQIMEKLSVKFTEKEIELILLILKTIGFPLRKNDPIALKEFIQKLQQRASQEKGENARVKFMLNVLLAIKNNNVSRIPQYDPSHVEHLKKVMRGVLRKGNTVTQFNVSLEDLLNADERGKWWVVGSAWTGAIDTAGHTKKEGTGLVFGEKMLELARKQRMNTDTRRNIFCILMTAEDYLDAFEKLHHLGLKDQQEREVIHVLIHCCLQESKFNPYYAVLAQKLCEYNRKYQITIQYAFWDKLKILQDFNNQQLSNLARFLVHLFIQKSLPFSIMKVVHFAELDKHTMRLLRQIMLGILLHEKEEACFHVFERVSIHSQLQNFRESLRLFINHFLLKNINSSDALDEKQTLLKSRAEAIDRILISRGIMQIF